jgi:hypothetical protein
MTGIGPVAVCCPRLRDRVGEGGRGTPHRRRRGTPAAAARKGVVWIGPGLCRDGGSAKTRSLLVGAGAYHNPGLKGRVCRSISHVTPNFGGTFAGDERRSDFLQDSRHRIRQRVP